MAFQGPPFSRKAHITIKIVALTTLCAYVVIVAFRTLPLAISSCERIEQVETRYFYFLHANTKCNIQKEILDNYMF